MMIKNRLLIIIILIIGLNPQIFAMQYIDVQADKIVIGHLIEEENQLRKEPIDTVNIFDEIPDLEILFEFIDSQLTHNKLEVLFFLHGMGESKTKKFKTDYEYLKSVYLENSASNIGSVVMITWNSSPLFYTQVQKNARRVVPSFQVFLEGLTVYKKTFPLKKLNMLCHSLGNYIFFHALTNTNVTLFENLIMSAPDIALPNGENKDKYQNLGIVANKVWILFNKKDRALTYSGMVNGKKRLGKKGLKSKTFDNIKTINTTSYRDLNNTQAKWSNHIYFRSSAKVMNILVKLLKR